MSRHQLHITPLLLIFLPILFCVALELWVEKQNRDLLIDKFTNLVEQAEAGTEYINDSLLMTIKAFESCDTDFLSRLQDLEYNHAAVSEVYILAMDGSILCSNEVVQLDFSQLPLNRSNKAHSFATEDLLYYFLFDADKQAYIVWVVSPQYVWAMSRLTENYNFWLVRYFADEIVMVNNYHHGFNHPESKQLKQQLSQQSSQSDQVPTHVLDGWQQLDYQSTRFTDMKLRLYYPRLTLSNISKNAQARIMLVSLIALLLGLITYKHIRRNLKQQIIAGVAQREFKAKFQPIVNMQTDEWVGAEALIRWYRHDKIYMFPDQFIPVAEQHNLGHFFHQICTDNSIAVLKKLSPLPDSFFISINISPNDLSSKQITDITSQLTNENLIQHFETEITERGIDSEHTKEISSLISKLSNQGIRVSLDDFGTGQSGLSYINSLHFDKIKIDKRFVQAINTDTIDFHILTTIIELADKLKVDVLAEGVETEEQKLWLLDNGIKFAQGWLFSKDLDSEQFIRRFNQK